MKNDSCKIKVSICLLLFVNCSLWLFNGIIGWKRITFLVACCGLIILCTKQFKPSKLAFVWLLFLMTILVSLLLNDAISSGILFYFFMYSLVVLYAILIETDLPVFKTGIIFLTGLGIVNALFVMIHFIFKSKFIELYVPLLKYDGASDTAVRYAGRGYYFGLNYKPHETAGVITFAIAAIILWGMIQIEYRKKIIYIAGICMAVPLLLTGKKGVIGIMLIVLMFMLLVWYASKKQWKKIGIAICVGLILLIVSIYYIMTHLDNPLFYRFASFVTNLSTGKSVDAGRGDLRKAAWQLWKENKLFGVGWFQYNVYTINRFGFAQSHSVNLDYLQFLCETGIVGFFLMITPIIVMLKRTIQVWKTALKENINKKTQWIIFFAVFVQGFTILYAFIEVPFYDIMYFTVYMFSCMIINNAYRKKA